MSDLRSLKRWVIILVIFNALLVGIFMFSGIVQVFLMEPGTLGFSLHDSAQYKIINNPSSIIDKDDIFGDSDDVAVAGAEGSAYFGAMLTGQGFQLSAADTGDGLGVFIKHNDVTGMKGSLDGNYTAWQQALAFFYCLHSAVINKYCP